MRESDLAAKIVGWLNEQHYEVYQEVQGPVGGIADLVAVMGCRLWVIETKTSLSLSVMAQAHRVRLVLGAGRESARRGVQAGGEAFEVL